MEGDYNFKNITNYFDACLIGDEDIDLKNYLSAYTEFNEFFKLLGSTFTYVYSDVKSKIEILRNFQADANVNKHYVSAKSMMVYEKENNIFEKTSANGSRTLLRLHRGLKFFHDFIQELYKADDTSPLSDICRQCYDNTLANFHPFLVRNGARLGMKFVPDKPTLLKNVTNGDPSKTKELFTIAPEMLSSVDLTYERMQKLYTVYDLHNLK